MESTKTASRPEILPIAVANRLHAKKMSLLLYFKSYIEDSLNKVRLRAGRARVDTRGASARTQTPTAVSCWRAGGAPTQDGAKRPSADIPLGRSADGGYPRVTRWFRTKHAILFRLSHGVLQVPVATRGRPSLPRPVAHGSGSWAAEGTTRGDVS